MGPATTSTDLLSLERKNSTSSSLESTLLVFPKRESSSQTLKASTCSEKLVTTSVPKSQVLGKLKDFLGVMAEANKRLQDDAKENCSKDYDIEALTGKENEYIEMDLVLGVADLNTPEAVAAAESAMARSQQLITLASSGSGSDTESSDDHDDDADNDEDDDDDSDGDKGSTQNSVKEPKSKKDDDSLSNGQPKKRSKIIEFL